MKKILPLVIFVLAMVLLQNSARIQQWFDPIPTAHLGAQDVLLYSTRQCPYCAKARRLFRDANIPFVEYDVELSKENYRQYMAYGGKGVPLIVIGRTIIYGYDPKKIRQAISALATDPKPTTRTQ